MADIPVHCLRTQVVGAWTFNLGPLHDERPSCGHKRPDSERAQPPIQLNDTTTLSVTFSQPDKAHTSTDANGWFSMVYDEGFEFRVDGKSFFAFSRFEFLEAKSSDSVSLSALVAGTSRNVSHCGETEVGWYSNMERTKFGCFYGKKSGEVSSTHTPSLMAKAAKVSPSYTKPMTAADHAKRVEKINMLQTTWKAKAYEQYNGLSLEHLNKRAGLRRAMRNPHSERGEAPSFLSLEWSTTQRKAAELPKTFDWRNVNGSNFLEPVMDQGDCGSCYVVSTVRMLSARHRIKTGDKVPFSISFPLYCSEYNQGCKGGYGNLVSRWSQDVGLVPATCAPYTTDGKCHFDCSHEDVSYRVDNHRYVGGYYGATNEADMMLELVKNGPFTVGVEPQDDFMYYTGGIYKSIPSAHADPAHGWERVDHAVLLVGWGEENGVKYWTIQNSWDEYWGEDGYMRIVRGENDSGVESIAEAADVVKDGSGKSGTRVHSLLAQTAK